MCADDFTRTARGHLGGWAGLFYSGAEKGVVPGINMEALVAVIGDGQEVILPDVRIVPPALEGGSRPPLNQNQWLRRALRQVSTFLQSQATNLRGCALAVDSAYVSPDNVALVKDLGMYLVSKLSANRKVTGDVKGPLTALVDHHKENRNETRIYLHFILAQVTRDAAGAFKCSPKDIMRSIRRSPERLLHELGFPSAFANEVFAESVPQVRLAA